VSTHIKRAVDTAVGGYMRLLGRRSNRKAGGRHNLSQPITSDDHTFTSLLDDGRLESSDDCLQACQYKEIISKE
jgi:hypothetical protein